MATPGSAAALAAAALALLALLGPARASAQAAAVVISPVNTERAVAPGSSVSGAISLTNPTTSKLTVDVFPADFTITASGRLVVLPSGSLPASSSPWLQLSRHSVTLAPNGSTTLRYQATVPESAKAGTHWGAIVFRSAGPQASLEGQNGIALRIAAQDAYVVYLNVGKLTPAASIQSLSLAPAAGHDPATFDVALQNSGNALLVVHGKIEVRSLAGKLVHTYDVPPLASLPGAARDLKVSATPPLPAGTYLATCLLEDGGSNEIAGQAQVTVK